MSVARSDFTRATILSKKISTKFFNSEQTVIQDLKIKYYNLMITICLHDANYLDTCRHYRLVFNSILSMFFSRAMYETPKVQADKDHAKMLLRCAILYCILSQHSNEQWDLLNRIAQMRDLEHIPEYKVY